MDDLKEKETYNKLFSDISLLYERARLSLVHMYWNIGKRNQMEKGNILAG